MIYVGRNKVGLNAITKVVAPPDPSLYNKPIKFRDCDGTVLYSYSLEEIAAMTALPALPTRSGLTCQGWNWNLQQIKNYAVSYGKCEVGATYTTDDGKTRIKLTIQDPKYTAIPIVFSQTVANGVKVNWGDGFADQTYSSIGQQTISHTYVPATYPATYTITFEVTSGTMSFPTYIMGMSTQSTTSPRNAFLSMIDEVNIGDGVTSIGDYAFWNCYSLALATISNSVTNIGQYAFSNCYSLTSITIPSSVTSIGSSIFSFCYSLASVTIPHSIIQININAFQNCYSLVSITIPNSVTTINNNAFESCQSLVSITIPNSVTSIGQLVLSYCNSLASITIPNSITFINTSSFLYCVSLASITISNSTTTISDSAFQNCQSLISITIPDSITNINSNIFQNCYSLASITFLGSIARINYSTFNNCYGLKTFDFRRNTEVPILGAVNAFQNTPTTKEIIVPDELYDDWIAASNWSSSTNKIKESIVKASESSLGPLV